MKNFKNLKRSFILTVLVAVLAVSGFAYNNFTETSHVLSSDTNYNSSVDYGGKCGDGKCGNDTKKEKKSDNKKADKCGSDKAKKKHTDKCGEGKCGEDKSDKKKKNEEKRCGDGKCGKSY